MADVSSFFKDKDGKIVIWQAPNVPLAGWLAFRIIGMVAGGGRLRSGSYALGTAFIFTWAYMEIRSGASPFRRVFGGAVMAATAYSFFN